MRIKSLRSILLGVCLAWRGTSFAQGFAPEEAVKRMKLPEGFEARLIASEPAIAQPVCIEFDDRGRLWVIQYLQYPNPAGLKRVKVDQFSRTVYDKIPEPPPRGPKGADRITILSDFDANGRARQSKDFVGGLNLASGMAFGHGGVFVLQTPYLLFYPDRNRDDVPDSDPEVLLTGFGMEDAHSVANSLTWGPDGWLYGCQGSTVTAHIQGNEFQQGVWRYHPITHRFELFCEGGGNSWGLDFDEDGNLIYSTNLGPNRMLHGVQGGYYWKSFGKHGALHNPYTYGYFEHVPHKNFTGGHVTDGGIIYQGDSFPEKFRGKYIANDLLGHAVQWHELERWGSSFKSAYGGELLTSNDTWFAPTDLTMGPDGSLFTADWYDKRTAHPDPDADWDRSNGRVYKIQYGRNVEPHFPAGFSPADLDMTKLSSAQLVSLLDNKNDWFVRKARRLLADRRDPGVIAPLRKLVLESKNDHLALESLWALYVSGGFDETFAGRLLDHGNSRIRSWTVRLLGDENKVSATIAAQLLRLADTDPDVMVRSQLASTAQRLPASLGLAMVQKLALRNLDAQDPYIPLLLWWAVERHAVAASDEVVKLFSNPAAWNSAMMRETILPRLIRRYAAEGTEATLDACGQLLGSAPSPTDRRQLLAALDQGLQERAKKDQVIKTPAALEKQLDALSAANSFDPVVIRVSARLGRESAYDRALKLAADTSAAAEARSSTLKLLGEMRRPDCVPTVLKLLGGSEPEAIQLAALEALQHFDRDEIGDTLLRDYSHMHYEVRSHARDLLLSRNAWALAFLRQVDDGKIASKDVPIEQLRKISLHNDKQLNALVHKNWGSITGGTPGETLAVVRRYNNDIRAAAGDPAHGHEIFKKTCAVCHELFGEGEKVGPELTHANRQDRDFLLVSIVDPNAVIRKEFLNYNLETTDGRQLNGLIAEQTPNSVTLMAAKNERTVIPRDQIKSLRESPVSLMPEGLLNGMTPQELRDLFSYLERK